jgi:DNA ligase (NAD+)
MKYNTEQQIALNKQSKHFLASPATILELDALKEVLTFHEYKYSVENSPLISDFEYDSLFKQLKKIEATHPELVTLDSPTQRVNNDLKNESFTVKHTVPMLSLDNSYNAEDLNDFDKQVKKLTSSEESLNITYTVEPKYDGGSLALIYENDILTRAATRGNGIEGEEMTANARVISSIPLRAEFSKFGIAKIELRGEALIRKDIFKKINLQREEEELSLFANPRNAATGSLRTKDPSETRKRGVEAFMYQIAYVENTEGEEMSSQFKSHFDRINLLGDLGFKIPTQQKKKCNGIDEVIAFCNEWGEKRDDYDYEIDGMVIKVDDYDMQELCGYTAHHPRWAIAYKFKAKQATTKLLNIEYQVGKIGSITPVAKLEPVQLAGVTVSSVSLHNEEFITSKDLRIGDQVLVERAGDVIPYIVKSMEELRDGSEQVVVFPEFCPINNTIEKVKLEKAEGEAAWRCPNCICGAQDLQVIIFHVSKNAMDIDGFGKSNVEKFYAYGWLKDISDVYNLPYEEMKTLEGFGAKSVDNLKASIDKAKQNPIHRLLHSLSIHHLGKKASKVIAEKINNIWDLKEWTLENFTEIKDIGPVVAENVTSWFANEKNISMLTRMEERGVNFVQLEEDKPIDTPDEGPLVGKSILFTGTLQKMGRKEAQDIAAKAGAKNISAISSKLDILVVGEKAGSKLKKAQDLGTVTIYTEDEFLEMIENS